MSGLSSDDKEDTYSYEVSFEKFKIEQKIDGLTTMVSNPINSLYFENNNQQEYVADKDIKSDDKSTDCFSALRTKISKLENLTVFDRNNLWEAPETGKVRQAVSMGFFFPAEKMYGLPERPETVHLQHTITAEDGHSPYRLFANDRPGYDFNDRNPLYA